MCVTSPAVASAAWGVPDLVNSWMTNSLSEGHRNMWVLPGWFIKVKTECEWRIFVTDGVENNICCCRWQIWRGGCHCRCAQDRLIERTFRKADANAAGNVKQIVASRGICTPGKSILINSETIFSLILHTCLSLTVFKYHWVQTSCISHFTVLTSYVSLPTVIHF